MGNRIERRDLAGIATSKYDISLENGQYFCETPKAYEIWQEEPLLMVKRIPSKSVIGVWVENKRDES